MKKGVTRILTWLVVIFVVYAILTAPDQAADLAAGGANILKSGAENLAAFFSNLLNRA